MRRYLALAMLAGLSFACGAAEVPEYAVKAAFLYNFAQFTDWPALIGPQLTLCTVGDDPFGAELDLVRDKPVGERTLRLRRRVAVEAVDDCQFIYVAKDAASALPALRKRLDGRPVLIVADSPDATRQGAMLNMTVVQGRVTFEANRRAARAAGLDFSSRLLRLATEVIQ